MITTSNESTELRLKAPLSDDLGCSRDRGNFNKHVSRGIDLESALSTQAYTPALANQLLGSCTCADFSPPKVFSSNRFSAEVVCVWITNTDNNIAQGGGDVGQRGGLISI